MTLRTPATPHHRRAVVLSGGGSFGAFEVGVLLALGRGLPVGRGHRPFEAGILTGTSVGAFNATFIASKGDLSFQRASEQLLEVWRHRITARRPSGSNGVYRLRLDPREYLDPASLIRHPERTIREAWGDFRFVGTQTLEELLRLSQDTGRPWFERFAMLFSISGLISTSPLMNTLRTSIDFTALPRSSRRVRVTATEWRSGRSIVFDNREMATGLGPALVRGSASIPGIFPPAIAGTLRLVDGGVSMNTPLGPAIHQGATEIHLVRLFPTVSRIPLVETKGTLGALSRSQLATWESQIDAQLRAIREQNRRLIRRRERAEQQMLPDVDWLRWKNVVSGSTEAARPIAVHCYQPPGGLGISPLDVLDFDHDTIEKLISAGFDSVSFHDCARDGCVLPGAVPSSSESRRSEARV